MPGRFAGRVAVITASGSGIGAATAQRLAGEGASVVVADLSGTRADAITASITSSGGRAVALKMDASDSAAVERTIRLALDTFGRLDVMVNNAGLAEPAPLDEISLESWNRVIAVTLTSAFLGMKHCLPVMRAQGKGVIVNTASISGTAADYGLSSYNAAKAGVPIAFGTDAGSPVVGHEVVAPELKFMVKVGVVTNNYAALRSATSVAAKLSHLEYKIGTLEAGKEADVIVVDGDPIADLDVLDHVQMTFIGGKKMLGVGD